MVLQILLLDKGDPAEFLASAVNPPTELAVANSIKYLCELQVWFLSFVLLFLALGVCGLGGGEGLVGGFFMSVFRVVRVGSLVCLGSDRACLLPRAT